MIANTNAASIALKALLNPNCARLFEGGDESGTPDPSTVLSDILAGTGYGTIQYTNMRPTSYDVNSLTYSINNATTSPVPPVNSGGTFASATITINTSSLAPYNFGTGSGGSVSSNAATLLHELGHVFMFLFGSGSTAILNDQDSPSVSQANTKLIQTDCFPGVQF